MYIARSAWRSRSSGSVVLSEVMAAPMLARITTCRPWNSNGERSASRIRSAARRVPASSVSSSRIANSSPPNRAVVSSGRITARRRSATATSSWSPASCPSESLTVLKSSRSEKRTDTAPVAASLPGQRVRDAVAEEGAVGEAGQRVVEGLVLELHLELLAQRDVVHQRAEVDVVAAPHRPDGQLGQELVAVPVQRRDLDPLADQATLAGGQVAGHPGAVRRALRDRDDAVLERLAQRLLAGPAEGRLRLARSSR